MTRADKPLALTLGDPAGIGPDITLLAFEARRAASTPPFVLLGDPGVLAARLAGRRGHFMNPALLDSQLSTLEVPADALDVDVALTPDQQVAFVRQALGL